MSDNATNLEGVSETSTVQFAGAKRALLDHSADPQRTNPKSFAVRGVAMLGQLIIPLGIAAVTILDDGKFGDFFIYVLPIALIAVGFSFLMAYLAWYRLTYQVNEADIRVEGGIISRTARSVPYDRIQDVSLEQKLIPRLFGLVEVKFETGAGGADELALTYLSVDEGERLRELVRARKSGAEAGEGAGTPVTETEIGEETEPSNQAPIFAMGPRRVITFGIFEFSLAFMAVLAGIAQQFGDLLPFDLWDVSGWEERLAGPGAMLAGLGPLAQVISVLIVLASLAVVGTVAGLVRTVLRDWGFTLTRTAKGFRRQRGLLTKTDVVMPAHRVQALKFGTRIIRRRFGWHGLKFVSLAQDAGGSSHDVAPFAQWEELEPIVRAAGFEPPHEDLDWHRASERYRTDSAILTSLFALPIAIGTASIANFTEFAYVHWLILGGVIAVGALIGQSLFKWRFERHAIDGAQLYSRRGWLAPRTDVATREKLQSVEIAQGPIAQRRGYASLQLGLAGGSFAVNGLPIERAQALRAEIAQSMAVRDFSHLI